MKDKSKYLELIKQDYVLNCGKTKFKYFIGLLINDYGCLIYRYLKTYRKSQILQKKSLKFKINEALRRKRGLKLGINIETMNVGVGIKICHPGNILINKNVIIGNNCVIHGNVVLGNNGKNIDKAPIIGNNVDIGINSTIIGDVVIGDYCIIGAHTLVNKSFPAGTIIVGVPGRKINYDN